MPQSQLKARDGARYASWIGTHQDQGCSSIWVAQSIIPPQAGALRGARILDKATMYWGTPTCTTSIPRPSGSMPSTPEHPMWQFAKSAGWHSPCCRWVTQHSPQHTIGPITLGQGTTQPGPCTVWYSQGRGLDIAGVVAWRGALGAHAAVAPESVDAEITLAAVVLLPSALIHVCGGDKG